MYLWSFVVYAVQVALVLRRMPPVKARENRSPTRADADG
jgi:hypothetical protein